MIYAGRTCKNRLSNKHQTSQFCRITSVGTAVVAEPGLQAAEAFVLAVAAAADSAHGHQTQESAELVVVEPAVAAVAVAA